MTEFDLTFLSEVRDISLRAGARIMEIYASDFDIAAKADTSPVTEADKQAEAIILAALSDLAPDIPAVAEEQVSEGNIPNILGKDFWLIDPLDGTREFINRNGEFTVNIALIRKGAPYLGVVYTPAKNQCHFGAADLGAFRSVGGG